MFRIRSLYVVGLNIRRALSNATLASCFALERSIRSSRMDFPNISAFAGGTKVADSPSSTISGTPPTFVATIGTQAAILSNKTLGEPSDNDGRTKRSAIENNGLTSDH